MLPAGTLLKIEHVSDATHTTCMVQNPDSPGKSLELYSGAYRWIVSNADLERATGVPFAQRTADFVGDLIAYETGSASPRQEKRFLRSVRKSGMKLPEYPDKLELITIEKLP